MSLLGQVALVIVFAGIIGFMVGSLAQSLKHSNEIKALEERIGRIEDENKGKALRTGHPPRP